MRKIILGVIILCCHCLPAWGQQPSIEVSVDRNTITVDDTLRLSIIIKGGSALTVPDIPSTGNFDVVGKSSGSAIEIINGQMSVTKNFEYVLAPRRTGNFTIGPVNAHIDGQTYSSGPVQISVLESAQPQRYLTQPPPATQPSIPSSPSFPMPPPGFPAPSTPESSTRAATFLTAETDKREAYVGEQVLFIFRLYTSVSIQNAQLSLPDFKDFIAEELIKERKYEVDLEGVRHAVNEWRLALFPTQAGSRETGVSQVKASVPVSRTISPFNDPFFQRYGGGTNLENRTFTAPSIAINVKKLPPAPQGFTGLVGQFSISSRLNTETLSMGDTANLEIEISGKGNIGEAGLPAFPETPFFKVYPGKPVLKVNKTLQGIEGKKTFQYAFVAERPGAASIPALEVYYFNPQTETYEKLSTETKAIAIRGGATGEKLVTAGLEEPAGLITPPKANLDLRGLKPPSTILSNQEAAGWEKMIWCTVLLGPPMLYFLYLGWERRKAAALASADDRKRSRAFKSAKTAVNRLNGGEIKKDLSILSAILKKYISDRFLVKGEALTPLEVEGLLESKNIPAEVIRRMIYLLDQMDSWKYGGMMGSLPDERELKIEVMELLREIEKAL